MPIFRRLFIFVLFTTTLGMGHAESVWEERATQEQRWREEGLSMIPHQLNYFFPFTYNTTPHSTSDHPEQHKEAKYQISFKVLLMKDLFKSNAHLYFGYTQLAFWQVYDQNRSAPFRDINHEPEVILRFDANREWSGIVMRQVDWGLVHQSNGTGPPDSRTWNRVYAKFFFDRDRVAFTLKPWLRFHDAPAQKDNPDIDDYMGYGEATLSYGWKNHIVSMMVRNNLHLHDNHGAFRLDYTFPLTRNLTGLLQYFTGYGESLVDYNRANNRYSVGIALSQWH